MNWKEFNRKSDELINGWCDRRELTPLRLLLNGRAAFKGLTDGYEDLAHALKSIRAQNRDVLTAKESKIIIELQHEIAGALDRSDS